MGLQAGVHRKFHGKLCPASETLCKTKVLVLSDKLLIQPNKYSVLSELDLAHAGGRLQLPSASELGSTEVRPSGIPTNGLCKGTHALAKPQSTLYEP